MAYNFLAYDEQQLYSLPVSIRDWVQDNGLARFVGETVDLLDSRGQLNGFHNRYHRDGWRHPAYHPRILVKVLLYGYCMGVTRSRKLAAGCENKVALRSLTANRQPNFRTISGFRKDYLSTLNNLFVGLLGLGQLGRVTLNGRKVAGNASSDQHRDEEWLKKKVSKLLAEAERVDAEEDAKYGKDQQGDELPPGLRTKEERKKRLEEALEQIKEQKRQAAVQQEQKIEKRRKEKT